MSHRLFVRDDDLGRLARMIQVDIFRPIGASKTTVFLCGADLKKADSLRRQIEIGLVGGWDRYRYDIVHPEHLFDELLYGYKANDLLSLEQMLAQEVDAIVVVPESPGSFAELGVFSHSESLREKLICVQSIAHKKHKSFINAGPIQLIKKSRTGKVVYVNPEDMRLDIDKIRRALASMKGTRRAISDSINFLHLDKYILPAVYLIQPVTKDILVRLVEKVIAAPKSAYQQTTATLTRLARNGDVKTTVDGIVLTDKGLDQFFQLSKAGARRSAFDMNNLDKIRIAVINWQARRKKLVA